MDYNCNDHVTALEMTSSASVTKSRERARLNVGGEAFVTLKSTLQTIPGTRLANLTPASESYDSETNEYFFDRNPILFAFILEAYRTGQLHFPNNVCAPLFKQELDFWGLQEYRIATCCWKVYMEYQHDREALSKLNDSIEGHMRMANKFKEDIGQARIGRIRLAIWTFLEDPSSSIIAGIWSFVYLLLLLVSVTTMVMETHPAFRNFDPPDWEPCPNVTSIKNPVLHMYCTSVTFYSVRFLSYFCNIVFFIELFIRFTVWPHPQRFLFYAFNVIDVISVVPISVMSIVTLSSPYYWRSNSNPYVIYVIISITGVVRSLRILKVIKHNNGLRVMILAVNASAREISLLLLLMAIGMLIFATMIYFAEFQEDYTKFTNIPQGFWWSLITMTTVGYGDMVPKTFQGQFVGGLCAITGILAMALPIPVIANNFNTFYNFAKLRDDIAKRDRAHKRSLHQSQRRYHGVSTNEDNPSNNMNNTTIQELNSNCNSEDL